ncbi:uncharacterized protein RSE6_13314 [Rhynchosporium secalis]|uniref:Uncharacterized protein n=1 Tax=Rhynchosporium secalis TaxID=38038 RepID=A0A1E1MSM3_RHYSE|nr:uncharacterized protein RSE6_13314 [Rhynchosporium secalis]
MASIVRSRYLISKGVAGSGNHVFAVYVVSLLEYTRFQARISSPGRSSPRTEARNCSSGTATDAVRDQVIRHNLSSAVYNRAYVNERVDFVTYSAVLERSSADGALRILTHISLICDPLVLVHVRDNILAAFSSDLCIFDLEEQRARSTAEISIWRAANYGFRLLEQPIS